MPDRAQLALDLARLPRAGRFDADPPITDSFGLPGLPIEPEWKAQSRTWAHAFHATCTYLGSLRPTLAHALICRWSRPGDIVLDPFCGRGSVPLQACLERRNGIGVDLNPLAALLTAAVVDPPALREVTTRLAHLRIDWTLEAEAWTVDLEAAVDGNAQAADAAALFHPVTLAQLRFLRSRLERADRADRFLLAALAGILHGGRDSHLTDAMPNTFSLAPAYTRRWLAERAVRPPHRDVFVRLDARLRRLFREGPPVSRGLGLLGDARAVGGQLASLTRQRGLPERVRLVLTSPPYLRVVRYGAANWLRLWLLGEDPARVDAALDAPASAADSSSLLRAVLTGLRPLLADDAIVALVLGDVESDRGRRLARPTDLAAAAWEDAAEPAGYRLAGVVSDEVDPARKLTRLWGARAGRATRIDRLLVVAPTEVGRRRALATASMPVSWGRTVGDGTQAPDEVSRPRQRPEAARRARSGTRPDTLAGGPMAAAILGPHAADVPPGRPRLDGSAGPHEEPRPRAHDVPAAELRPAAAGAPIRAGGQRAAHRDRPLRRG